MRIKWQIVWGCGIILGKPISAMAVKNGYHPMKAGCVVRSRPRNKCVQIKTLKYRLIKDLGQRIENGWSVVSGISYEKIIME